ncbi:MAG: NUDIX hydrolase [Methylococcaceae bacterium]|nr:NUDIX hydrolase [Methylococcaceae bacterium]MDZ4157209.1 NUDIX hydrolase [Methylococcales bacterium]MDP2392498.1 NUDIX hydrolase [Methylococcaceae bacterium]MDP3020999.1 NUDIX hydrolase [Methylococcaceae bacterium]MDP3388386.1 NUDIX hydrolase [Methylococcaceae bacterium]
MSAQLIQSLLPHLPRFAEEEGDFYSVPRSGLIDVLSGQVDQAIAENTIGLLETLLDTLAVLDRTYLQKGEWCFVSFPAQLLATSILTAMSDADSRLFAANFWNTQGIGNDKKDQQRDVLRSLEQARVQHQVSQQAQPIRYCYVAWGIIKLDGRILFYQREDTQKRFEKAAGDYGLIGGRANQNDLPITDKKVVLKALQSAHSELIKRALPETLKRELREEAGLVFESHYTFKPWRSLKPYRQVQGTAPNHALTEYYLDIFQVELTLEGYLFLQQKIKSDERLTWFSLANIKHGETTDDKRPYINALHDEFGGDRTALVSALSALPDSFVAGYLSDKEKYGITLPIDSGKPLYAGVLGKEKPLELPLSPRQLALVLALAAHLRGFEFASLESNVVLHPHGWLEVDEQSPIRFELMELARYLGNSELAMENRRDRLFRLSIRPETVFFADDLFSFAVASDDPDCKENGVAVFVGRQGFDTALGVVKGKTERFEISRSFAQRLKTLADGDFSIHDKEASSTEDNYKKSLHKESRFKALGLRNLIRQDGTGIRFVLPYLIQ